MCICEQFGWMIVDGKSSWSLLGSCNIFAELLSYIVCYICNLDVVKLLAVIPGPSKCFRAPLWGWDNSLPHCHIQQLAVEFRGTQLTQTVHGMSQNDLSNKAVSINVHVLFLTPLVLFSTHLDLYVCWCQNDNMQRNATQYSWACSYCRSIKLCKLLYPWESVSESLRLRSNQSRNDCRSEPAGQ